MGAWCGSKWFQVQWDDCSKHVSVAKKLIPIVIAIVVRGTSWNGHKMIARYDNESIVTVLNSHYSNVPHVMNMMQTLFFIDSHLHFIISLQHTAGLSNTLADCLSKNQLTKLYVKFSSAHHHSSVVTSSLLQWLLHPNMDWTSHHSMEQFNTFVLKEKPIYTQDISSSIKNLLLSILHRIFYPLSQYQSLYCVIFLPLI